MSERHANGKVESKVAFELGMCYREMSVAVGIGGIDGFHARIESKDEEVEVETDAETV